MDQHRSQTIIKQEQIRDDFNSPKTKQKQKLQKKVKLRLKFGELNEREEKHHKEVQALTNSR